MSKLSPESFFLTEDFRIYLKIWAKARGRGEYRKIAQVLGMHSTLISQILNGRKCFTEEQASRLCAYMKLNLLETDYFLKLVQIERAGSEQLKETFLRHLHEIRELAGEVKSWVAQSKTLSVNDRALFYSSWQYGVVRLLTSIEGYRTQEAIATKLNLPISRVQEILDFLVSRGLCVVSKGQYVRTEKNTHIESRSPLAVRHHQNWRAKSVVLHERQVDGDMGFTAPVALSKKDFPKVRVILLKAISEISTLIEDSRAEELAYIGIDWLKL
jgi:uncharacterized protein (TIGR02147 family)